MESTIYCLSLNPELQLQNCKVWEAEEKKIGWIQVIGYILAVIGLVLEYLSTVL